MKTKGVSCQLVDRGSRAKFLATSDGSRIEQYSSAPALFTVPRQPLERDFPTRASFAATVHGLEYIETYPWMTEAEQAGERLSPN